MTGVSREFMVKTKSVKKFVPLTHENLEIKNELLQIARNIQSEENEQFKKSIQENLSSVLIYSNIAEYLAENLLENLNHYIKESTYKDFGGILFINSSYSDKSNMTLGQIVKELDKFDFPDKVNILKSFKVLSEARNKIFHNLAKSNTEAVVSLLEKDLPTIKEEGEDLVKRINIVYVGLQKILLRD